MTNPTGNGPSEPLLGTGTRLRAPPAQQGRAEDCRQPCGDDLGDLGGALSHPPAREPPSSPTAAPHSAPTGSVPLRLSPPAPPSGCPVPNRALFGTEPCPAGRSPGRCAASSTEPCRAVPSRTVPCRAGAERGCAGSGRGGATSTPAPCGAPGAGGGAAGFGDSGQGKAGPAPATAGWFPGGRVGSVSPFHKRNLFLRDTSFTSWLLPSPPHLPPQTRGLPAGGAWLVAAPVEGRKGMFFTR